MTEKEKPINRVYQMASGSAEENASFKKHMADKKARMAATRKIIDARIAKKKRESTEYSSAYVRALMEEDEPTKKEAKKAVKDVKRTAVPDETKGETIEFEQKLKKKTPKKKYFGGKSKPEDVDTKAAIASHRADIKRAGQEGLKKLAKERKESEQNEETLMEVVSAALKLIGPLAKRAVKKKVVGKAVQAGAEGVATASSDRAKKRAELQQQGLSDKDLEEGYKMNNYVKTLVEARRAKRETRGGGGDPDPIVQQSGDPEAHGRRWSPIPPGSKAAKPLKPGMTMKHGETQAQTHARYKKESSTKK